MSFIYFWASPAQTVKKLPTMQETWVCNLGLEDPLVKEMATYSSTLAWKIPRTEEPSGPVRPVAAGSCSPPRLGPSLSARRPPPPTPPPPPPGGATGSRGGRSVGRGAACARGSGGARGGRPRASASPPSRAPPRGLPRPLPRALRDATSDQTWRPAEFKHISQRRKRN